MTSTSARIFLIRHGDTDWVTGGKHASHTEVPLSKQGEAETELIRERLFGEKELVDPMNVAKMYSLPLHPHTHPAISKLTLLTPDLWE